MVVSSLAEFRDRVVADVWPPGFPEALKGLGGVGAIYREDGSIEYRDPGNPWMSRWVWSPEEGFRVIEGDNE